MNNNKTLNIRTIDEKQQKKIELTERIKELKILSEELNNEEQGIKLTMNSIYGAIGNNWFICFNPDVAEAVTLQGQDLVKFSEIVINKYFHEYWHNDKEIHNELGIFNVRPLTKNSMVVYGDTDSNYVTFNEVINSCEGWEGSPLDFILQLNEKRIEPYLRNCFEIYAKRYNTHNSQDFELESVSINGIFLGKKKYVLDIVYDSGQRFNPSEFFKYVGVEIAVGGTAPFVREKLMYLIAYIFEKGQNFELRDFIKELKEIKKEFNIQIPDNIAKSININGYEKYILNDTTDIEVASKCPVHVRGSGYYNYLLNNSKYKSKYSLISSGESVKMYYIKDEQNTGNNIFAYPQGVFPYEFAPPIDHEEQFTKNILGPINRFIEVMGYNRISSNLFMINPLW